MKRIFIALPLTLIMLLFMLAGCNQKAGSGYTLSVTATFDIELTNDATSQLYTPADVDYIAYAVYNDGESAPIKDGFVTVELESTVTEYSFSIGGLAGGDYNVYVSARHGTTDQYVDGTGTIIDDEPNNFTIANFVFTSSSTGPPEVFTVPSPLGAQITLDGPTGTTGVNITAPQ